MEELTAQHLHDIREKTWIGTRLIDEVDALPNMERAMRARFPDAQSVRAASNAMCEGIAMTAGDVVLASVNRNRVVGELWFFANVDGLLYVCLSVWEPMACASASTYYPSFKKVDNPMIMECGLLATPVAYLPSVDCSSVTVSMPPMYRN